MIKKWKSLARLGWFGSNNKLNEAPKSDKADKPVVKPGQWIRIGKSLRAVVCAVGDDDNIEVVYLDHSKAINESVKWTGGEWRFAVDGLNGGYADNYPRLREYVNILRSSKTLLP